MRGREEMTPLKWRAPCRDPPLHSSVLYLLYSTWWPSPAANTPWSCLGSSWSNREPPSPLQSHRTAPHREQKSSRSSIPGSSPPTGWAALSLLCETRFLLSLSSLAARRFQLSSSKETWLSTIDQSPPQSSTTDRQQPIHPLLVLAIHYCGLTFKLLRPPPPPPARSSRRLLESPPDQTISTRLELSTPTVLLGYHRRATDRLCCLLLACLR
ncbi:hypothetical protein B0J15DRAFT_206809 [Fusarium solani]|uniref:Uncharacterized protein n=1 Tax=Fusarium solani TaxID=169388 RepID=A0A9P9R9W5_FUSSL|nr:uncharacterized protein B0J15DRAFT_206809 [Fusarium solani]KAH7271207.1 hypothetical protein B0J15DRAFT_206809 [Fusarium solani]